MMFVYGMLVMWLILGAIILISDWLDSGGFWIKDIGWATGIVMLPYLVFITGSIVLLCPLEVHPAHCPQVWKIEERKSETK